MFVMMNMVLCLKSILNKDKVLSIAVALAVLSSFAVRPDSGYIDYIDFRTLAILFSLMLVMEGIRKTGFFDRMAKHLISKAGSIRQLVVILIMLCFFSSMLITNDVALITFVPLTIAVLNMLGRETKLKWMIPVIVMQTVAANLGSMLTPIGNPQNLYLSGQAGSGFLGFVMLMLPFTVMSLIMIVAWNIFKCRDANEKVAVSFGQITSGEPRSVIKAGKKTLAVYLLLFGICVLAVARVIDYRAALAAVLVLTVVTDIHALKRVDYTLLLTFAALFVFIGNLGRMELFSGLIENIVGNNEIIAAVAASQVISNVPAALLLSGFTHNYSALIIGTNIGGLGTIIASMASLISYKYVASEEKNLCGRYMVYFTAVNVVFLAVMVIFAAVAGKGVMM